MAYCDECRESYNSIYEKFYSIEKLLKIYDTKESLYKILDFINDEIVQSQLFFEIYIMSRGFKCVQCNKYIIESVIETYIQNLYDTLVTFINQNNMLIQNIDSNLKNLFMRLISKYPYNKEELCIKLFNKPLFCFKNDIPEEHYNLRNNNYFSDHISGHPMASHGWAYEALNNIQELIS